ncbi:MAG: hypothetical protein RBS77_00035 [Candidatus Moranbacteria bacterium]|jgi:hypothetical protein|nr:hypothetical protein [Candidatus Moranbacteria bacterium]
MYYHKKIIISGNYVELYEYEQNLKRNFTRNKNKKKKIVELEKEQLILDFLIEDKKETKRLHKRIDSINRTRTSIRRIINSNQDLTKFYTLTFKKNIQDVKIANRFFNKFIMKMNYRYQQLKYIAIIEFQHRGAVHYHFLCNLPYIKSREVADVWEHGFIKIKRIKNVSNLGAYVCKYLQKDMEDERLFNKKKFFCSKNINKPIEVYGYRAVEELILQYDLNNRKPDYETPFEHEYIGKGKYKSFEIKNIVT